MNIALQFQGFLRNHPLFCFPWNFQSDNRIVSAFADHLSLRTTVLSATLFSADSRFAGAPLELCEAVGPCVTAIGADVILGVDERVIGSTGPHDFVPTSATTRLWFVVA